MRERPFLNLSGFSGQSSLLKVSGELKFMGFCYGPAQSAQVSHSQTRDPCPTENPGKSSHEALWSQLRRKPKTSPMGFDHFDRHLNGAHRSRPVTSGKQNVRLIASRKGPKKKKEKTPSPPISQTKNDSERTSPQDRS